jgi:hypothetical protein
MLALLGCEPTDPPPELGRGTFAGEFPKEYETLFVIQDGVLQVDASGDRIFFPIERETRSFDSEADFLELTRRTLAAEPVLDEARTVVAMQGRQTQVGNSFFYNADLDLAYLVTDPIRAYLGGLYGRVVIAGQERCLDSDGDCLNGIAEYLSAGGVLTRPTQLTTCDDTESFCARGHSFFNYAPYVFPAFSWARHGSNEVLTTGSATEAVSSPRPCEPGEPVEFEFELCIAGACIPLEVCVDGIGATSLATSGTIWSEGDLSIGIPPYNWALEAVTEFGVNSVETAFWCFDVTGRQGSERCEAQQAVAVCGFGRVNDFRIPGGANHLTGNGPSNFDFCGP